MPKTPFLEHVAAHVLQHHGEREVTVILPSQRAAQRFLKAYARLRNNRPGWLPKTDTLNGLLRKAAGRTPISSMEALARLYLAHQSVPKPDGTAVEPGGFASFLQWGRLALQDFNELDQYLCPVAEVLKNLTDIKELDHWHVEDPEQLSQAQKRYLEQYMRLLPIYKHLHAGMEADHVGTGGAIARKAAEEGQTEGFGHVVLAGMGALTPAEMAYLKRLAQAERLTVFADADLEYVKPGWEAGEFISEQQRHLPVRPLANRLAHSAPSLRLVGCSTRVFECQYVRKSIHEWLSEGQSLDDTVVVLPDGRTLSMLMQSLDLGEAPVNVTMGLAWSESPVADFFDLIFRMVARTGKSWRHDELRALLSHPVTKVIGGAGLARDAHQVLGRLARRHWVWVGEQELNETPNGPVKALLQQLQPLRESEPQAFLQALTHWCGQVQTALDDPDRANDPWLPASWQPVVEAVNVCAQFHHQHGVFEGLRDVRDLVFQVLNQERIDLRGEPDQGLQIMGIIETRALDFKRVVVLDCNEGTLPKTSRTDSFIPYDLRAALKLPMRHQKEAIYAYYLYRLLNRAEEVTLVYLKDDPDNEASRYLKQLEQAFKPGGRSLHIAHENLESQLPMPRPEIQDIAWTAFAENRARTWASNGISPSALNTMTQCPRNFYYQYLMRMREPDSVEEVVSTARLGSMIHEVFEKGLEEAMNRPIRISDLESIAEHVSELLDAAVVRWYNPSLMQLGENRISRTLAEETIIALVEQEVRELKAGAQRTLRGLEIALQTEVTFPDPIGPTAFFGKADRVDVEDGHPVMIDYKSGKVEASELKLGEDWTEKLSAGKRPKALQLLMYAAIAMRGFDAHGIPLSPGATPDPNHPGAHAGIRSGRRARSGLMKLEFEKSPTITHSTADAFLNWVAEQLGALYSGEVALRHSEDQRFCPYCVVLDPVADYF